MPVRKSTREAIIEAAFDAFSRDAQTTLGDIASAAGVGRATLHRHFAGRAELVRELALIAIDEMDDAAETACENVDSSGEALRRCLEALIPLGSRHGFLAREPVEDDPAITAEFERQVRETRELVVAARDEGVFDPAVPVEWIVRAYEYLLYAGWESVRAGDATPAQASAHAWRTLTSGLASPSR